MQTRWIPLLAVAGVVAMLAACSSSDDSDDAAPAKVQPLSVLVTNDDGYDAPGLEAVVNELLALPGVTVTVVAPATNQSGTGGETTPTPVTGTKSQTLNGFPAVAVEGFPADAVVYALEDVLKQKPDLVVSGVNEGPNFGPLATVSGTVGAAEKAASVGIPAIAASQGLGDPFPDYASGAKIVSGWVAAHRNELATGDASVVVLNLNVPTCSAGTLRGVKQVPPAPTLDGATVGTVDCSSTATAPKTDTAAFGDGFASVTSLQADGAPTTSTTAWSSL
ncbi:MAG: 5'/3'-nucleotidase SurE [Acidimicrobiia bacterium]